MLAKSFRRRLFEFSFGTVIAQALSLLLMPVVSRLYSPDEMGEFAIYVSMSTILSIAANLRLDVPIVIAKTEDEALGLLALGQIAAAIFGVGLFAGLIAISSWRGLGFISPWLAFMIALSTYASATIQSFANFFNRHQWYKKLAARNAGERFLVLAGSIGLGWAGFRVYGLPVAQTVGLLASVIFFYLTAGSRRISRGRAELWQTLKAYGDFPRKNILSTLLNASSVYGAPLLFAFFFSKAELGTLNLASRVFDAPIYLVGNTFQSIYYRHVVEVSPSVRLQLFWRSLKMLLIFGILPATIISWFGEPIFRAVFGEQWAQSGRLAIWLAPYTLLRLGFVSQMGLLLVHRRLSLDLGINSAQVAAQIAGFFLGYWLYGTVEMAVAGICVAGGLVHLLSLIFVHGMLKREIGQGPQPAESAT